MFNLKVPLTLILLYCNISWCREELPSMISKIIKKGWLYDEDGNLTIVQRNNRGAVSNEVDIFFKERLTECNYDQSKNSLYFDIVVCLMNNGNCKKGLKICYLSELSNIKDEKFLMPTMHKDNLCDDGSKNHFLQISIDPENVANIYTSIDENVYKVALPAVMDENDAKCFKIKVGTVNSIATLITDLNDAPMTVIPPLPSLEGDFLKNGWSKRRNNFHLFLLDFIPKRNKWLKNYGDYYKKFVYQGTKEVCNLTMQFTGEKLHHCALSWEETGFMCPGPYVKKRNESINICRLNPDNYEESAEIDAKVRVNTCDLSIGHIKEKKHSHLARDILTSGTVNETEDYKKILILPSLLGKEEWNAFSRKKKIYKVEDSTTFEEGTQLDETKRILDKFSWKLRTREGCDTFVEELFVICNGWRWKVGQYRFNAMPNRYENVDKDDDD